MATIHHERIARHEVHVWCARVPPNGDDTALHADQWAVLNDAERAQFKRFRFDALKRCYLTTRALVRSTLSRYVPIAPAQWVFEPTPHGRPVIVNPEAEAQSLRFNISHTNDCVVLALGNGRELGVDIECTTREAPLAVARRFFSPVEAGELEALSAHRQPRRFWDLWTFKESYIKARGLGLSVPLDAFSFRFDDEHSVRLELDAPLNDSASRWQLWQFPLEACHQLALCAERVHDLPTVVSFHAVVPMRSHRRVALAPSLVSVPPSGWQGR